MASAFFSLIDSIGETFEGVVENVENVVGTVEKEVEGAVQQMDAGVDLDDVLEEIQLATDEAALLEAYRRLEVLATSQAAVILHGWVVEDRVVPVVCAALCRVESAKLAAAPLARTLNGMGRALDSTGTTFEETCAFHEQIVRRTENGKAMLKLLQATDPASRTESLALLRRVYPQTSKVLGRHLLSDPQSIAALMQILQEAGGSSWADVPEEAALCAECVHFLRLVTAEDGDVRMIITFQDGAEALLAIATQALSVASSSGSLDAASALLSLAGNACVCVQQLVGQGPVAQKYMREAGHLTTVLRTLRCFFGALALQAEGSAWTSGLHAAATVLLDTLAAFVMKAGSEAAGNSKVLVQSRGGLLEMVCMEVLPCPGLGPLRLRAVEVLAGALAAAEEKTLASLTQTQVDRSAMDVLVSILLGSEEVQASLELRASIEVLLTTAVSGADVRQVLLRPCLEEGPATAAGSQLLSVLRAADRPKGSAPAGGGCGGGGFDWFPADGNTWFAARLLETCLLCDGGLRKALAEPRTSASEQGSSLLTEVLGPLAGLARAWRSQAAQELTSQSEKAVVGDPSASLCALLQLVAEWCNGCTSAAEVLARSPAQLPELVALLEPSTSPSHGAHVRGLTALVLGTCLLQLPSQEDALVSQGRLMEILAARVGVDAFTRAAEEFLRCLNVDTSASRLRRYPVGFPAVAARRFQEIQEAMVRIWLERGAGGVGSPAAGMAEDVAEHFKDLIKMQDKELRSLRAEVQQLKEENTELRKLTTDEDKTLLLWKVGALTKQCEALQAQSDLLQASRGSVEVARLRERQRQRTVRQELEQQLQVLALALDEAEARKEPLRPLQQASHAEVDSLAAERDELLAVLTEISNACPEVAGFLAPLGFAPSDPDREVSAWEAAAECLGHQAMTLSLAGPVKVMEAACMNGPAGHTDANRTAVTADSTGETPGNGAAGHSDATASASAGASATTMHATQASSVTSLAGYSDANRTAASGDQAASANNTAAGYSDASRTAGGNGGMETTLQATDVVLANSLTGCSDKTTEAFSVQGFPGHSDATASASAGASATTMHAILMQIGQLRAATKQPRPTTQLQDALTRGDLRAFDSQKPIPTELRGEDRKLRKVLDLADDRTKDQRKAMDDEYAYLGVKDPKVLVTTSRDPSSRLSQFLKELRMLFPGAQRMNRGSYVVKDLMQLARSHEMTDVILVHEHRGEPDGMVVCHLPFGPTAYFGLSNVVLRHDLAEKPPAMSEASPHLVFHGFTAKTGIRVKTILQALFPPAKQAGDRVMTFANHHDVIHFRHHSFARPKGPGGDGHRSRAKDVALTENGPRFQMRLFRVELGTIDMKDVEVEWVLRPYFNRQKQALALPDEDGKCLSLSVGVSSLLIRRSQRPEGSVAPSLRRPTCLTHSARPGPACAAFQFVKDTCEPAVVCFLFGFRRSLNRLYLPTCLLVLLPDVGDPWPESGPSCWGTWRGEET
ncbi:imp4 [Symbiodinium sp. CCMP2456]|nr:imp4 [Symbiodinium sp. CCMP2456]